MRRRGRSRLLNLVATRFRLPAFLLLFALVYGAIGYRVVEDQSLFDGFYYSVVTLATLTVAEDLSTGGRVFTMSLIVIGLVALFDLLASFGALLASGELGETLRRRRMRRRIEDLDGHYVICAFGRVGRAAMAELRDQGAEVAVVDIKAELEPLMVDADVPYLIADPTEEGVLVQAGIHRAKGLICAVDSDADNVYITLTARSLNPSIFIVARASSPQSVDKLERAGADRVVSPYSLSGTRMAALALRPAVVEFVDTVTVAPESRLEEIIVRPGSPLLGATVAGVHERFKGILVLAVKKVGEELLGGPPPDIPLETGDLIIAFGPASELTKMAESD